MIIVRYEFKLYNQNSIDSNLMRKLMQEKEKQMRREQMILKHYGICPKHRIYMNAYHKCDLCGD